MNFLCGKIDLEWYPYHVLLRRPCWEGRSGCVVNLCACWLAVTMPRVRVKLRQNWLHTGGIVGWIKSSDESNLISAWATCGCEVTRREVVPVLISIQVERVETTTVRWYRREHTESLALLRELLAFLNLVSNILDCGAIMKYTYFQNTK